MARIRTVKPELARHEGLYELEIESGLPIRIAWVMMFGCCDREGRFKWRPRDLKLDTIPYDECDFSRVLDAWLTRGYVVKYRVGNEWYGHIPTFRKHQSINNKEPASVLPSPDSADETVDNRNQSITNACVTRESHVNNTSVTPLGTTQGEGKGREGKGKEHTDVEQGSTAQSAEPDDSGRSSPIVRIFEHWKSEYLHPKAVLDAKRRKAIGVALKAYSEADICAAISGYRNSPHHMGQNESRTVYDEITLFLRDAEHIDRGLALARGANGSVSQEQIQREIAQGKRDQSGNPIMFGGRQVEWQ